VKKSKSSKFSENNLIMEYIMKIRFRCLFVLLLLFSLPACSEKIEPGTSSKFSPVVMDISVETARMTNQPQMYEAIGTIKAGITSNLASKLLGTIEAVRVREGDRVKKGDTLIIMDQRQVKAGVNKAEAALSEAKNALAAALSTRDAARAQEKLSLATYKRYQNLKKQDLISTQNFEEREANYSRAKADMQKAEAMVEAATARVKQAEAEVATVRVSKKDAMITAPHDGIITNKFVDKGDLASPGTPLLNLETTYGFCVDMILPETYIDYVQPRQKVFVKVPALKTGPLEGNVCTIVPSADPKSHSFIVKINLPIDKKVRSGLFARVEIPMGHAKKLLISRKAIITRGQLTGLYLVDAENIANFRLIRIGKISGDSVEILSGLKEGDRYVLEPTPTLLGGARIRLE
jgi:multidrug efflux pump subunit AcrA (membrane-fusion protein)